MQIELADAVMLITGVTNGLTFTVMLFENEKPMAVVAHNNITEIVLSKQKLEESEKNLKQVMDNSNWMIASIDR